MIFTEIRFLVLFVACWITFFALPRTWRTGTLAFWGIVFYATYAGWFLPVVLALTLMTFFAHQRATAWTVGCVTVGLLAYFKVSATADQAIGTVAASPAAIFVPLGFSFLSFELLHVVIERRRGRIPRLSFMDLLAFAFFFPTRVAGPIKRYPEFLAATARAEPSCEHVYAGLLRILLGLAKKLLLADVLALTVMERTYVETAVHAWVIVLAYALQIFFDFSAYSDIAIGLSAVIGITVPENFARPYFAPTIREFWNRWHMTLSFWVRDYVFMPTGRELFQTGLRSSPITIATISYLLTFLTVGAWHGLTIAFLVWGLYHGVLLAAHHVIRLKVPARVAAHPLYESRLAYAVSTAVTFTCVTIGWVPFMTDWKGAIRLLALMFGAAR